MRDFLRLRGRIINVLASSGLVVASTALGCGGTVGTESGDGGHDGSTQDSAFVGDGSVTPDAATVPACMYGMLQKDCFTHDQLVSMLASPPRGGDANDGGIDASFDPNGCLDRVYVADGCCNPANSGPTFDGTKCCYTFCTGACCGRPLVIDGDARVAPRARRGDWRHASREGVALDIATRRALADAWLEDARMEHASIASFARFTLDLMACAAPPELLAASQRASIDEVEHARLCFALASRFAGEDVGPGPLDASSTAAPTLAEAAVAAVREGCVGETLAALTARAQLRGARDHQTRAALRRIARDEETHAELAWRFVAWAITTGGNDVRAAVARAFYDATRALAPVAQANDDIDTNAWRAHGRLTAADARDVMVRGLRDVIAPCARALI